MPDVPTQKITPFLHYHDIEAAIEFLSAAFGFEKFGVTMTGPDGKLNHAAMRFGEGFFMMGDPGSAYKSPAELGQVTQSQLVLVDDVEQHFETARNAGAEILEEIKDLPWGDRRYGARDPEGHCWYFAQRMR